MKFMHAMIRVYDLEKALDFFVGKLGLIETRRKDFDKDRFSLIFLAPKKGDPEIELTYNWDQKEPYLAGRNFGHLAFSVKNIYETCHDLMAKGVQILRPPRDGYMAFIRSPDQISIELLQEGDKLPPAEPWISMSNQGQW